MNMLIGLELKVLENLEKTKQKPDGYVNDVLSYVKKTENGIIFIEFSDYENLKNKYSNKSSSPETKQSVFDKTKNLLKNSANAIKSVVKTEILRIDRVTDEEYDRRLNICRSCPGNHAVFKDNKLYTCGPMLKSAMQSGESTCGCILDKKARDSKQHCPFNYW